MEGKFWQIMEGAFGWTLYRELKLFQCGKQIKYFHEVILTSTHNVQLKQKIYNFSSENCHFLKP